MPVRRLAHPALLGALALFQLSALSQTPATPQHEPRLPASGSPAGSPAGVKDLIHSLEKVKSIRETDLSPDGHLLAWNVSGDGIQVAPLDDPAHPRHITACAGGVKGSEGSLAWSPDSKTLAFFSDCTPADKNGDRKTAIFLADAASGGAPRLLAHLNGFAKDLQWTPDGKFLSFLYVEGATRPSGALAAMKPPSGVIGVEGLEVQRVAVADAVSGALTQITPANLHVYEFDWSSDSKELAFIAAPPPGENNWWVAKLFSEHAEQPFAKDGLTFEPKVAFDPNTTPGALHGLQIAVPRWSPDGSQIAFIGGLMSDQGSTGGDIYTIPATSGEAKDVTPNRPASPSWFQWIDNQQLGVAEFKDGQSHLFVWNIDDQQESDEYNATVPATIGAGGLEMRISIAGRNIAFIESSFDHPPEVYAGPLNNLAQITHYNDALKPAWGKSESVQWTNDGFHVQGWLLYPANYDPAKKYPMIVMVHGGPSSAVTPRWPGAGFGGAPFSALGYFVLEPNPRGSYGEGEKFTAANRKDFGYGDLSDIEAGVDAVTKKYSADPQRVGITGWSYGGFMTMFAVSQTHRFRAAVAGAGISNWQSYYGENSIDQWMIPFFGASVYDDPAVYAKSSAIDFIKQVKTPTLVVVGDRDGECPAPQSFEFWHALRDENVPTELVVYPNEGHGFSDPAHRIDVLERALGWFGQYMK
jgi:dipeptidyl aminopeptidase/acylaminoacyl peptidase